MPVLQRRVPGALEVLGGLFSLPDKIGCPGCVDEPVDWITVDYSDGTKKTVMCNAVGPPTEIANKVKAAIPTNSKQGMRPVSS